MALPPSSVRAPSSGFHPSSRAAAVTPQAATQAPRRCLSSLFRGPSRTKLSLVLTKAAQSPGREAALAWASLAQRFPASSVLAREGAGCGSVGPGLGTEHLPGALCSGTGSPALGLCSP